MNRININEGSIVNLWYLKDISFYFYNYFKTIMIYRRLLTNRNTLPNRFFFGVDAKKITIGVPKEVFEN